jgi:integrase
LWQAESDGENIMAVKRTKTGRYEVDFREQNRKRIQRTFDKKKDAEDFYNASRVQVRQGKFIRESKDTVGQIADKWLKRKKATNGYRFGTIQNWETHVEKYIKPDLGDVPVQRATIQDCEEASLKWKARTSGYTANMVLRTLSSIFALAQRYGPLEQNGTNVAEQAERIKLATEEDDDGEIMPEDVYTEEDLCKLVSATPPGTLDRLVMELGGFCGLRIGEILGFTWPSIDLKAAEPEVRVIKNLVSCPKEGADFPGYGDTGRSLREPKSKKSRRSVPAPRELVHDLRLWKLQCPQTPQQIVMATVEGKPLQRSAAQDMMDAACEKAQVTRRTLHRLRHTFASLLLTKGKPLLEVSRLLGHRDIGITATVYAHFTDQKTTAVQDLASSVMGHGKK